MRVPLLDLSEQYRALAEPIREAIDDVLASHRFILGPKGEAFEKAMCAYCKAPHAIGVSSGTDAFLAILTALGIGAGDAVVTTPYTFFATGGCIARVGAKPLFVDIDPVTYNIRASAIRECLEKTCRRHSSGELKTKSGEKVRAIVPVHLFGLCCEMEPIHQISRHYQLDVIEDAAQAIGAEYPFGGKTAKAGAMGDAGFFSFYPSKNLGAAGDAGMILCRDDQFASGTLSKSRLKESSHLSPIRHSHANARCSAGAPRQARDRDGDLLPTWIARAKMFCLSRLQER